MTGITKLRLSLVGPRAQLVSRKAILDKLSMWGQSNVTRMWKGENGMEAFVTFHTAESARDTLLLDSLDMGGGGEGLHLTARHHPGQSEVPLGPPLFLAIYLAFFTWHFLPTFAYIQKY